MTRQIVTSHQQAELLAGLHELAWSEHSRDWHDWLHDDKDLPAYEVEDADDWLQHHHSEPEESCGKHERRDC